MRTKIIPCVVAPALVCSLVLTSYDVITVQSPNDCVIPQIAAKSSDSIIYNNVNFIWEDNIMYDDPKVYNNFKRLTEFAAYKENWDGEGAPAFSSTLIELIRKILKHLRYQPEIFPIAGGAIQLEYRKPTGEYLEFEVAENEVVNCYKIDAGGEGKEFTCACQDINEVVNKFYETDPK